ncbi:hydrogenase nickel incorporation protein HypB [candidate division WOR-3 bacterium]|nr:hydrogenase nickel incorporation protein HypB [candidate division WOR-3 bacterium]
MRKVKVFKPILVSNKERAAENRKVFDRLGAFVVNIIASPGAGKTSFISKVVTGLQKRHKILVIEGDIRGQVDSERLALLGVDVVQINTQTACHLDAFMIAQVLPQVHGSYDLILVENVGNLVCPAEFEIGEDYKLAILSVTEGDDKPYKYPLLFHLAQVVVINKTDLLPYVDFNMAKARTGILQENPHAVVLPVSSKNGEGYDAVIEHFSKEMHAAKKAH